MATIITVHRLLLRISLSGLLVAAFFCLWNNKISYHHAFRQQDLISSSSNSLDERRKLSYGRQGLRFAIFGSSIAWGAGLASRYEAYAYQLSPKVTNYATYSGGPNYPATCTETLVGDQDTFDVVVLDYYLLAPEGVANLARKLRSRFPQSVMVFVKIWTASMLRRKLPDGSGYETLASFQNRLLSNGFTAGSLDLTTAIINDNAEWIFPPHVTEDNLIAQAASSFNGLVFEMDLCNGDAKQFLIQYLNLFDSTSAYGLLSQHGHDYIAAGIEGLVSATIHANSTTATAIQGTASSWGRGDHCNLWYTSGHCELVFSKNYQVVLYDDVHGKYALEIAGDSEPGWFNVTNPFEDARHLYLSYMSTSTAGVYPRISLTTMNGIVLNPVDKYHTFRNGVDAPITVSVGVVPPGDTTIFVNPVDTNTPQPFRLVGYALTDENATPDPWKFTPPFNQ